MTSNDRDVFTSSAFDPNVVVDQLATPYAMLRLDFHRRWLSGAEPYLRQIEIPRSIAPRSVVPDGYAIERCVTTETAVTLLARGIDGSMWLNVGGRATTLSVSAATDLLAAELVGRACESVEPPPHGKTARSPWTCGGVRATTAMFAPSAR